ncbi:hypothetical protein NMD14_05210 [Aeromonas veronii]
MLTLCRSILKQHLFEGSLGNLSHRLADALMGNALKFGWREALIEIVVAVDNRHGFGRGGFVWR